MEGLSAEVAAVSAGGEEVPAVGLAGAGVQSGKGGFFLCGSLRETAFVPDGLAPAFALEEEGVDEGGFEGFCAGGVWPGEAGSCEFLSGGEEVALCPCTTSAGN